MGGERKLSEEHKRKISQLHLGRKRSEETKRKISESHKSEKNPMYGKQAWNNGIPCNEETKKKISEKLKGKIVWNKGIKIDRDKFPNFGHFKKHIKESNEKNRQAHLGKKHTKEARERMSRSKSLEKHYNWNGGTSFYPYPPKFNTILKRKIRERDNYICQMCGIKQKELNYKLHIHHIDYCKNNIEDLNLISLCRNCHGKTHYKREYYMNVFYDIIKEKLIQRLVNCVYLAG